MTEANRYPYLPKNTILLLRQDDGTHELFVSEDVPEEFVIKAQELITKQNIIKKAMNLFESVNV